MVRFARLIHRRVRAFGPALGRRRLRRRSHPGLVARTVVMQEQRDPYGMRRLRRVVGRSWWACILCGILCGIFWRYWRGSWMLEQVVGMAQPRMLVLARESRAMTQGQLAKAMQALEGSDGKVSQGYVSRAEAGRLTVNGERLGLYARALHYPAQPLMSDRARSRSRARSRASPQEAGDLHCRSAPYPCPAQPDSHPASGATKRRSPTRWHRDTAHSGRRL